MSNNYKLILLFGTNFVKKETVIHKVVCVSRFLSCTSRPIRNYTQILAFTHTLGLHYSHNKAQSTKQPKLKALL